MAKSRDAFRTIGEVSDWLDTPAHVLRFWESKFSQVKPVKRAGGRRYYRPQDISLLAGIKTLLHDDGMTIKGAQKLLREKGVKHVASLGAQMDELDASHSAPIDIIATPEPAEVGGTGNAASSPSRIPSIPSEAGAQSRAGLITLLLKTTPEQVYPHRAQLSKLHARLTHVHGRIAAA